jgi:protocatechuate 3,4-dioxygenase, alpha subunit
MGLKQTPSQTVGPFFAYGLTPEQYGYPFRALVGAVLVDDETPGERIRITGRVLDGEGHPVPDAMIEIWQADSAGRYAHPADQRGSNVGFKGFGRCGTGTAPEHRFTFATIKPGSIGDGHAPHVNGIVFMRGMLSHVFTRIYFDDEAEANARDPVLASVEEARRQTLIAAREATASGTVYRFDLHMQGPDETVFFDV